MSMWKFNYDRLRIDKALGDFRKSDNYNKHNKNKNNSNIRRALGFFPGAKSVNVKLLREGR